MREQAALCGVSTNSETGVSSAEPSTNSETGIDEEQELSTNSETGKESQAGAGGNAQQ